MASRRRDSGTAVGTPAGAAAAQSVAPTGRNRYVDLLRLVAIVVVVLGHWFNTTIRIEDGYPVGESALEASGYMRWFTLVLQIMPLFFLAGGFAAAASWSSWQRRGGRWAGWVYGRLDRLLRPTTCYVAAIATAAVVAWLLGAEPSVLDQAGWGVALQLWFLAAYLPLLVLAVPILAAWTRLRWLVLVAAVAIVAVLDVLERVADVSGVRWLSLLIVPAAGFMLGMSWRDGAFARPWVPPAMLVIGVVGLLVLIHGFGYPPWMIGVPGEPPANTNPPNLALMAYASAQLGIVLLLERPARRFLQRPRAWAVVIRGNSMIMTLYLWHMVPVLIVGALIALLGLPTGPATGTVGWWLLRIPWYLVLGTLLLGLIRVVGRFERPGPPRPDLAGRAPAVLLVACTAATTVALTRLALDGFAPEGRPAFAPVLTYAAGVAAMWAAGRWRVADGKE